MFKIHKFKTLFYSLLLAAAILAPHTSSALDLTADFRRRDLILTGLWTKTPTERNFGSEAELNWTVWFVNAAMTFRWLHDAGLSANAFFGVSWGSHVQIQIGLSQLLETKARLGIDIPWSDLISSFPADFGFKLLAEGTQVKNQSENNLILGFGISHRF